MDAIFYISGAIAILATLLALTRSNTVHALLYLIVSLMAVAVVFYVIGAPFVAALEVIIYAGAIMVLFIFVVMVLNLGDSAGTSRRRPSIAAWAAPAVLGAILLAEVAYVAFVFTSEPLAGKVVDPVQVGISLFGRYLLGVELASILLLAGLVGTYHLGAWRPRKLRQQEKTHDTGSLEGSNASSNNLVRTGADRPVGTT